MRAIGRSQNWRCPLDVTRLKEGLEYDRAVLHRQHWRKHGFWIGSNRVRIGLYKVQMFSAKTTTPLRLYVWSAQRLRQCFSFLLSAGPGHSTHRHTTLARPSWRCIPGRRGKESVSASQMACAYGSFCLWCARAWRRGRMTVAQRLLDVPMYLSLCIFCGALSSSAWCLGCEENKESWGEYPR